MPDVSFLGNVAFFARNVTVMCRSIGVFGFADGAATSPSTDSSAG